MVHAHELTYVLLRCALFVVHESFWLTHPPISCKAISWTPWLAFSLVSVRFVQTRTKKLAECQDMEFLYDINTNKSWLPWDKQTPSGCGGARLQGYRPLLVGLISGWLGTLLMSIKPYFKSTSVHNPRIPIQDTAMQNFVSAKRGLFMSQLFGSQRWAGAGYPAHGQQFYSKATCLKRNAMINHLNFRVSHFWTISDQTKTLAVFAFALCRLRFWEGYGLCLEPPRNIKRQTGWWLHLHMFLIFSLGRDDDFQIFPRYFHGLVMGWKQ